ncbi:helix-turn-helix domain-containing protein [Streptomyces sp. HPF1205]|uniref:TetR/AcrR family transcriptional regulator n=1 Tax=Streptomyces sp. HPF1205 TaxID=2873262 RepID=UPI0027DED2A7|nr:helix-turn-helix domain-containing protein [Streptomyces sp. HPF1205]
MRADAQRNYDRLLEEARQAFIVRGTDVALEDIARHAGVGIGTLYRHFPDRYTLMNAVFEKELDALTQHAHELITADDPAEALTKWLRRVAVHSASYRGLSAAIMENGGLRMPSCKTRLRTAGGALLWRAQEAGAIRPDAQIGDLLKLTHAMVLAAEKNPEERGLFDRLMDLALDGLRTRGKTQEGREGTPEERGAVPAAADERENAGAATG